MLFLLLSARLRAWCRLVRLQRENGFQKSVAMCAVSVSQRASPLSARDSVISLPASPVRTAHPGNACWQGFEVVPKQRILARKEFSKPRNEKTLRARRLERSIEESALRARHLWSPRFSEALRARIFGRGRSQRPCHERNLEARLRSGPAGKEIRALRHHRRLRRKIGLIEACVSVTLRKTASSPSDLADTRAPCCLLHPSRSTTAPYHRVCCRRSACRSATRCEPYCRG